MALVTSALLVLCTPRSVAQETRPAEPGSELTVYLITMGPGQAIYERFGHNAIWVADRRRGTNAAFNYGVFDMNESGFILHFLQGRMWYWLEPWDAPRMIETYKANNRSIWLQELNLTPRQRLSLYRFLLWNAQPDNRAYRYDYYTDNCSTRVRDTLDNAIGQQISRQLKPQPADATYRWHTRRITKYNPLMYTALYFVLGPAVDRPLSAWDEGFLPMDLQRHLRSVTVRDANGQPVPFVAKETLLHQSTRSPLPTAPPNWLGWYLAVGLIIGALLAGLAYRAALRSPARWAFAVVSALWLFILGSSGAFSAGAWLLTTHGASYRNQNLFQASPLALPLVVLAPALAFGKRWAVRPALILVIIMLGSSILGLVLKIAPWFHQVNGEMIALVLPAHLGTLWAVYHLVRRSGSPPQPPAPSTRASKRKRKP